MTHLPFTKVHGLGNDYVLVDARERAVDDPPGLARRVSNRHRGVGADGLILLLSADESAGAHLRMRMFNADGSEAEMCGNGIRCLCKYAYDHGLIRADPMRIQSGADVLTLRYQTGGDGKVRSVTVDMGEPKWGADEVGVRIDRLGSLFATLLKTEAGGPLVFDRPGAGEPAEGAFNARWLSMGNPHMVFFCRDVSGIQLDRIGPLIEHHEAFPQRINVQFVERLSASEVIMRTWERGSGATQACGTGAAAVCVAGAADGVTGRELLAHLPGGDLELRWDEASGHVFLTGPAVEVFSGNWPLR